MSSKKSVVAKSEDSIYLVSIFKTTSYKPWFFRATKKDAVLYLRSLGYRYREQFDNFENDGLCVAKIEKIKNYGA